MYKLRILGGACTCLIHADKQFVFWVLASFVEFDRYGSCTKRHPIHLTKKATWMDMLDSFLHQVTVT